MLAWALEKVTDHQSCLIHQGFDEMIVFSSRVNRPYSGPTHTHQHQTQRPPEVNSLGAKSILIECVLEDAFLRGGKENNRSLGWCLVGRPDTHLAKLNMGLVPNTVTPEGPRLNWNLEIWNPLRQLRKELNVCERYNHINTVFKGKQKPCLFLFSAVDARGLHQKGNYRPRQQCF